MSRPFVLGIDPGLSGAYALVSVEGVLHAAEDLPVKGAGARVSINSGDLRDAISGLDIKLVVIELVSSMPKQGVASSFKFGYVAGQIEGVVSGLGLPILWVTPRQWKGSLKLGSDKEQSRAMAIEAWPEARGLFRRKKDDGRAEAALMARYGVPYANAGLLVRAA